jgi:hypothetical protein
MMDLSLFKESRPALLEGEFFNLKRQVPEDAEPDYATVMANRDHLRAWCHDSWPEDNFTLEQNRDDLEGHIEEANEGFAYGYTVWDSQGQKVLGSVYLYPSAYFAGRYKLAEADKERLRSTVILVDYWLDHRLEKDRDFSTHFIRELRAWLRDDWGVPDVSWATRPNMEDRREFYRSLGMTWERMTESVNSPGWFQTFHI